MLCSLELLVEKIDGGNFRVIIFEVCSEESEENLPYDPYTGGEITQSPRSKYHTPGKVKSVMDIIESPEPWRFASGFDAFWTAYGITISEVHANVNFGRAKTLATKIKKICESLG